MDFPVWGEGRDVHELNTQTETGILTSATMPGVRCLCPGLRQGSLLTSMVNTPR